MEIIYVMDCFNDVETEEIHVGYYYTVSDAIKISILGCMCGLKNMCQISQWAASDVVREFLKEKFAIERIPCYYWYTHLLKIVKPESLSKAFTRWVEGFMPEYKEGKKDSERSELTISVDGKTVCSTANMKSYGKYPLHIVSAQLAEYGLTLGQCSVESKSNEIPAVQELLHELDIRGCLIVADALNCQVETAKVIIKGKGDYLLNVKDNQETTKEIIEEYIQEHQEDAETDSETKEEKNRGRSEKRTAYSVPYAVMNDSVLGEKWPELATIGAIHREVDLNGLKSDEWHYYISSRNLTAKELLHFARMEWTVETMHWFLDVIFEEDMCRVEDPNVQRNLNIIRKVALNCTKQYKKETASKEPVSHIMFSCLMNPNHLMDIIPGK